MCESKKEFYTTGWADGTSIIELKCPICDVDCELNSNPDDGEEIKLVCGHNFLFRGIFIKLETK